jgi:hypothetical protein
MGSHTCLAISTIGVSTDNISKVETSHYAIRNLAKLSRKTAKYSIVNGYSLFADINSIKIYIPGVIKGITQTNLNDSISL